MLFVDAVFRLLNIVIMATATVRFQNVLSGPQFVQRPAFRFRGAFFFVRFDMELLV